MKRALFLALFAALAAPVRAQTWPAHPVRIVIPLSPGGFADVPGRMLAARLSASLGQNVFVENRPGAGGTIGADAVAKSAPDGYTLLFTGTPHVIAPWIYKKVPYEALKDFEPVALVASGPYVLVANPQLNVHSVRELIAAAKAQPGKIDYASSGNGSAQHLVSALFASSAGIELNHVPYKGSGPAMQDLLGGRVKLSFAGIPNVLPQIKAGRLIPLAVSTPRRSPDLPEVPTVAEAGVPGFQATLWLDLAAPHGTPAEIVQRVTRAVAAVLKEADIEKNFRSAGVEPTYLPPAELASFMQAEYEKWGRVVRQTGATIN